MHTQTFLPSTRLCVIVLASLAAIGCEGINRHNDERVVDIQPPPIDADLSSEPIELPNFPDSVEQMLAARNTYIDQLIALERGYLIAGDTTKANWARRQRELTEKIEVYPYLTDTAPEERAAVAPEEYIPEADELYEKGVKLIESFQGVPFTGYLPANQEKARTALALFKQVLSEYPQSDKVDDCAFYCGEIYKEYLRDDDPDNELAIRYYKWAFALDPQTPHPARFACAVVYDFRLHNRDKAIELYNRVLETEEAGNNSNQRFAATRIEQLTDDDTSHLRPKDPVYASEKKTSDQRPSKTPAATAQLPEEADDNQ